MRRFPTAIAPGETGRFAVLLNINARGVNKKVREAINGVIPEEHLFISRSPAEADRFAEKIIKERYAGVFSGGGDGSLVMLINMLWKHVIRQNELLASGTPPVAAPAAEPAPSNLGGSPALGNQDPAPPPVESWEPYRFPMLGILKLGTGNGWAGVVGSRGGVRQLRHALKGTGIKYTPFDLIEAEGRRFHFSGLGWDALILNDYIRFKAWAARYPRFKKYATTLPGYLASTFLQTIPLEFYRIVRGINRFRYRIINRGKTVYRIEGGGRPVPVRFGKGDIIFQGPANIVGVATTTNYGFGMKAFPWAMTMPGMMNLRIVQSGIPEVVMNLGPIWDGTFRTPRFKDFLVSDVEVLANAPAPFHVGGDAEGYREQIRYRVASETVRVVDFSHD